MKLIQKVDILPTSNTNITLSKVYMQPPNNNYLLLTSYRFDHTTTITWTFQCTAFIEL